LDFLRQRGVKDNVIQELNSKNRRLIVFGTQVIASYFIPVGTIVPSSIIAIFDPDAMNETGFIYSFISSLMEGDRTEAEKAMVKSRVNVGEIMIDILSHYKVRQIPSSNSEFQICLFALLNANLLQASYVDGGL